MSSVTATFAGASSLSAQPAVSRRPRAMVAVALAAGRGRAAPKSLYQVLQVAETATALEIKVAYRSMAKRLHPDASPQGGGSGAADFIEIRRAYETLADPAARARYDWSLSQQRWRSPADGLGRSDTDRLSPRFGRWETDQCW
ncbi:chaperone protein dnaJ 11, chloroplastic-like [Curcuma longa]|uniref:chaperone protein dnaJ 11, chloroplastic-like n=1 Tax=Curcuma longa TaxID=136217 RepID=UPI003D9F276B